MAEPKLESLDLKALEKRYMNGEQTAAIARSVGLKPAALHYLFRREGVAMRPRGNRTGRTTAARTAEIVRLHGEGRTVREITKALRTSSATVAAVTTKLGLESRTKRHLLSAAQVQEGLALYKRGADYRELATRYGVSASCVSDALHAAGLKPRTGWAKYRVSPWVDRKGRSHRFKSSWERKYAAHLDSKGLDWDYEPTSYPLQECVRYTPDFVIYGSDRSIRELIDVKGWLDARTEARLLEFRKLYPDYSLRLVGIDELLELGLIDAYYGGHAMAARVRAFQERLNHVTDA